MDLKIGVIENSRQLILPTIVKFLKANNINYIIISKILTLKGKIELITKYKLKGLYFTNGTDSRDVELIKEIKKIKYNCFFLFSELGWLPYKKCFYLDFDGIGNLNSLFKLKFDYFINKNTINKNLEASFKKELDVILNEGKTKLDLSNYVLVVLQVDGDSKLNVGSPYFKNMKEFINYIIKWIPEEYNIAFKNHPHNKNPVLIPKANNIYDITHKNYNKKELLLNATLIVGINSTMLLESLYLGKKVCSFGLDVFSNKNLVIEDVFSKNKTFDEVMKEIPENLAQVNLFLNELYKLQIYFGQDANYYKNTYWGKLLKKMLFLNAYSIQNNI